MKTIDEKEKKLEEVLNELKNLEISKPNQSEELEILEMLFEKFLVSSNDFNSICY